MKASDLSWLVLGSACWGEGLAALTRDPALTLPSQIAGLITELADEHFKGDVACQVLEGERAERLQAFREVQELKVSREKWQGLWRNSVAGSAWTWPPLLTAGSSKPPRDAPAH